MMKISVLGVTALTLGLAACTAPKPPSSSEELMRVAARMQYWHPNDLAPLASGERCSEARLAELARPYLRPEMMALGDSLYNGVSSLRVNWWLSEWSAPSQIAIPLGLIRQNDMNRLAEGRRFWGPQYPAKFDSPWQANGRVNFSPYYPHAGEDKQASIYDENTPQFGLDIEKETLFGLATDDLREATITLLGLPAWRPPNRRLFNDNIAYQGADSTDLLQSSSRNLLAELDRTQRDKNGVPSGKSVGELLDDLRIYPVNTERVGAFAMGFFAVNGAFVLNPMGDECIAGLSAIEQVELRRPKRLLVNIGSNNGIWKVAFGLLTSLDKPYRRRDWDDTQITLREDLGRVYLADMRAMVERLAKVRGLDHVYINGLLPPSRAANLMPSSRGGELQQSPRPVGAAAYYDFYRPVFSLNDIKPVDGAWLGEADKLVRGVNEKVKALLDEFNAAPGGTHANGSRKFVYVDVDELTGSYDYKHRGEAARRVTVPPSKGLPIDQPVHLDNRALRFGSTTSMPGDLGTFTHLSAGGLFSFDNMHLTPAGYGLLASTVLASIVDNEKLDVLAQDDHYEMARDLIAPRNHVELKAFRQNNFLRNGTPKHEQNRETIFKVLFKVKPSDASR
jgi:hypothetical protein